MSSSVVGENGIQPLIKAKAIQKQVGDLPLMVNIGNNPPDLAEIADRLTARDIITHCFNGKPNRVLTPQGELKASVQNAIAQGILPETISSDIYCRNRLNGPVHNLAHVMSKFFSVGMTLPQVIDCVTWKAAEGLRLTRKGRLEVVLDAAAEEDLQCYYQYGADLVIYSGAKAIEGPTSGLVIGRQQYVEWVKRQSNGIGRAMKVGKEGILGLTQAIENYLHLEKSSGAQMVEKMTPFIDNLNQLHGVSARAEIKFDEAAIGQRTGDIAIYFRGYKANEGIIEADVRSVSTEQLHTIFTSIQALLNGGKTA